MKSERQLDMRFVLDGMLGRLTRWLRLLGYDAKYPGDSPDEELLRIAEKEDRILLTNDTVLYRRARKQGLRSYLAGGSNESERLANVARNLDVNLNIDVSVSRCPTCNASIFEVDRFRVKGKVSAKTFNSYRRFWICSGCGKIYWRGSHWKKIEEMLRAARERIR
jgi:uncharacterized protein with PIN domain